MYVFKDRVVLECLYRTTNAFGRIGEYIRVEATPAALQLSVVNSSSTVLGRADFPASLFAGPGATRTVLLKARALDVVLKRIDVEDVGTLRLRFRVARSGQEQLELFFGEPSGVNKQFRINCLETVVLPVDFAPLSPQHCSFACLPGVLKDAFASCEASADEARMQFQPQHVSILAKRRGAAGQSASVLNMGLKTIIKLQPAAFRQLTVLTPWQAEFKLKEFRVVLAFFLQISEQSPIAAAFDLAGPTTPIVFSGSHPSCPDLKLEFKFMARVPGVRNAESATWLRVGPQSEPAPASAVSRRIHSRSTSIASAGASMAMRERAARPRADQTPVQTPLQASLQSSLQSSLQTPVQTPGPPLHASLHSTQVLAHTPPAARPDPSPTSIEPDSITLAPQRDSGQSSSRGTEIEAPEDDVLELGFTQPGPVTHGLFD